MNNTRRKMLEDAYKLIGQAQDIITDVSEEERGSYYNLPEGLQESELGETLEGNADFLDDIVDVLDSCYEDIISVIDGDV